MTRTPLRAAIGACVSSELPKRAPARLPSVPSLPSAKKGFATTTSRSARAVTLLINGPGLRSVRSLFFCLLGEFYFAVLLFRGSYFERRSLG